MPDGLLGRLIERGGFRVAPKSSRGFSDLVKKPLGFVHPTEARTALARECLRRGVGSFKTDKASVRWVQVRPASEVGSGAVAVRFRLDDLDFENYVFDAGQRLVLFEVEDGSSPFSKLCKERSRLWRSRECRPRPQRYEMGDLFAIRMCETDLYGYGQVVGIPDGRRPKFLLLQLLRHCSTVVEAPDTISTAGPLIGMMASDDGIMNWKSWSIIGNLPSLTDPNSILLYDFTPGRFGSQGKPAIVSVATWGQRTTGELGGEEVTLPEAIQRGAGPAGIMGPGAVQYVLVPALIREGLLRATPNVENPNPGRNP